MNIIENYNDYLLDLIIESAKHDQTTFIISDRLRNYLRGVESEIANDIINLSERTYNINSKITLLDVVDKEGVYDLVSFVNSSKAIHQVAKDLKIELKRDEELSDDQKSMIAYSLSKDSNYFETVKGRMETTIGRLINKILPDQYKDHEIGIFVEKYKSIRQPLKTFDIVKGNDIQYWYNEDRYKTPDNASTIWRSCMRHESCYDYLDFYSENSDKVSLLILKDPNDETKIIGRAIVWKIDEVNGENVEDIYFMDRIYYYQEYIMNAFITYATEKKWMYKSKQNMNAFEKIIDTKDKKDIKSLVVIDLKVMERGHYPYADTMKFFETENGALTNYSNLLNKYITLDSTEGGATGLRGEGDYYSEYYGENIDTEDDEVHYCEYGDDYRYEDDCFYSEYYSEWITNEYAEENGVWCDYTYRWEDSFRMDDDYVTIYNRNETATRRYADNYLFYNEYIDEYLKEEDAVYSDYYNTYLYEDDSVKVYLNIEESETDWRADNDSTWFEFKGKYYDENVSKEKLEEMNKVIEQE